MLSVAIALEPPSDPIVVRDISASCEEAIGAKRCPDAATLPASTVVSWFARVRVDDPNASLIRIEFHDRGPSGTLIESRSLSFSERDDPQSRWASVGAVIAAFVAARDSAGAPPPSPPLPRPLPLPVPAPQVAPGLGWNVDVAVLTGPGLDSGAYRLGALGRGYLALPGAPGVLALVSARYAERPGNLQLAWWSASCGLGARLGRTTPLSGELTGELAFERLLMSATDAATSKDDDAAQNRFGGRLSVNLALKLVSHLAWVAGAEATALRPAVAIAVGHEDSGRAPAVTYAFSTGLRFFGGD
ncbi:MAG TPA: hypothetical protein VHP33_14070 [Polyangiaceae bacterium]|nr:hypothetical protein [Polyangiaceae bacterium]